MNFIDYNDLVRYLEETPRRVESGISRQTEPWLYATSLGFAELEWRWHNPQPRREQMDPAVLWLGVATAFQMVLDETDLSSPIFSTLTQQVVDAIERNPANPGYNKYPEVPAFESNPWLQWALQDVRSPLRERWRWEKNIELQSRLALIIETLMMALAHQSMIVPFSAHRPPRGREVYYNNHVIHLWLPTLEPDFDEQILDFAENTLNYWAKLWYQKLQERLAVRQGLRVQVDGPKPTHSQSRSLKEYYSDAFKKWKKRKGFVLWDSVKDAFDSVANTNDFRKLTDSLGLPITHVPGIGKALKAIGNFTLSAIWVAPKIAKAVMEETKLPPEQIEKAFGIAKFIDSVTPGPWGSSLMILYFSLASAGKAPSKAAMKAALSAKAATIEKIREVLERERRPKMHVVSGKSSSRTNPYRKFIKQLEDISAEENELEENAVRTADIAQELSKLAEEYGEYDPLDIVLMAIIPAHERLISQGDQYEPHDLLDMSVYLAEEVIHELDLRQEQRKVAAGPRLDKEIEKLNSLRPILAQAANQALQQCLADRQEKLSAGACGEIASAMADVLHNAGFKTQLAQITTGDEDAHEWPVVETLDGLISVDIEPETYEDPKGSRWLLRPDAKIKPTDVFITSFGEPEDYGDLAGYLDVCPYQP